MQSRLYFSKLGEPFLHKALVAARPKFARLINHSKTPSPFRVNRSICTRSNTSHTSEVPSGLGNKTVPTLRTRRGSNTKEERITPNEVLAKYLDLKDVAARQAYWKEIRNRLQWDTLPAILMHYLHTTHCGEEYSWDAADLKAEQKALKALEDRGLTYNDVEAWARIVSTTNADERVDQFFNTLSRYPSFLLLELCRKDFQRLESLKTILVHVWDRLLPKSSSVWKSFAPSPSPIPHYDFEDNAFSLLLHRLLAHCRRLWPAAMVTVAKMVDLYIYTLPIDIVHGSRTPDPARYRQICHLQNDLLRVLALPAAFGPLQYMVYNWSAQKVILGLSNTFSPPLTLDQSAYQAVIQVLVASKKSHSESKSARLRARTWPPWREEQDGMDAQRESEEDLSRSVAALMRKRESGYADVEYDQIMSVLGGQEPDGTPTIQTRAIVKRRSELVQDNQFPSSLHPKVWAARVESTRDVQEAWAAFTEYTKRGGEPSQPMYYAMFRKLAFDKKRLDSEDGDSSTAPGDGLEVLPVPDDNISDFYRSRLQPPARDDLYRDMVAQGVRPSGRLLSFLLKGAPSLGRGLNYLRDSELSLDAMQYLYGGENKRLSSRGVHLQVGQDLAKVLPSPITQDLVKLLCRFAPRAFQVPRFRDIREQSASNTDTDMVWVIRAVGRDATNRDPLFSQPLQHAALLLKASGMADRSAWYALWKALAQRNIVLSPNLVGQPMNFKLAWRITSAALQEFHQLGLELDPQGFRFICMAFTNYARVSAKTSKDNFEDVLDASETIKAEFRKLIVCNDPSLNFLPRFMHTIHGVQLHAFVNSMAVIEHYDEIISMLEWMVLNYAELESIAFNSANGMQHLRQTLIAIRVSCEGTAQEARARALIDGVRSWDGWPTDDEVEVYHMHYKSDHVTQPLEEEEYDEISDGHEDDPKQDHELPSDILRSQGDEDYPKRSHEFPRERDIAF